MADKIRFAVLCAGKALSAAAMRTVERLLEVPDVLCAAVLEIGKEPVLPGGRAWSPYRAWYSGQPRTSIYDRLEAPKVDCPLAWESSTGIYEVSAQSLARIAELKLDFCLQAVPFHLGGDLADMARFGVWTLFQGETPPAFTEIERGEPHLKVSLVRLGERPGAMPQILRQGVVNVVPRSYGDTLQNATTAGFDFPALVARELLRTGTLPSLGSQVTGAKLPSAGQVLRFVFKPKLAWVRYQWSETLRSEMWNVGVVNAPIETFLDGRYPPQIDWLPGLGSKKFVADPFAVEAPEGFQLLTEEFDYDRSQGYITSALYRPGMPLSENRTVIDDGVHMSYPFPLLHEGQQYCIPECHTRREVAIYRMQDGTDRWVKAGVLIRDFAALDSTLIQHDGKWWLFCSSQEDLRDCKLYIWHAPDLFGPWEQHASNPVKCDVRCSRPGGTPFLYQGDWYRPAQDSSTGYGSALSINRVVRLTVDEFEEETVAHIQPPADIFYRDGLHTLSMVGRMTVLDGKRMALVPSLAMRRFLYKLKRLSKLA